MSGCADPVICFERDGKRLFRHFSVLKKHTLVLQKKNLVFNCGKCLFCRRKKCYELAARCVLHASLYEKNCFLTLTYDEKKEGYHNELDYSEIQKFKKRLRKHCVPKRIEIFNVHEYGRNGKKHWHLIVFNHDFDDRLLWPSNPARPLYTSKRLEKLWPHGFSTIGDVSEASAMYQAQYTQKDFKNGNITNGKKSKSVHSGIGRPFFNKHYKQILSLGFIPFGGRKLPLPRYFLKLAHKHYCHYYNESAFKGGDYRNQIHRPFKPGLANKEIADLYLHYKSLKVDYLIELEKKWEDTISTYLTTERDPAFIQSNSNALHDLKLKQTQERF